MPRKNKRKPEYRRLKYNTKFSDQDKGYNSFHKKYEKRTDVITINPRASTKPSSKKTQPNQSKPSRTERGEVNAQNVPNAPINTPYKYAWKDGNPMPRRGEIWYVDLGEFDRSSVQRGIRPAVIVSSDIANEKSGVVTVVPLTSKMKKTWYPSHILINNDDLETAAPTADISEATTGRGGDGARETDGSGEAAAQKPKKAIMPSQILAEQLQTVDKQYLGKRVGKVKHLKMLEIEEGMRESLTL